MRSPAVVDYEVFSQQDADFRHAVVGFEIDFLVLDERHSRSTKMLSRHNPLPFMLILIRCINYSHETGQHCLSSVLRSWTRWTRSYAPGLVYTRAAMGAGADFFPVISEADHVATNPSRSRIEWRRSAAAPAGARSLPPLPAAAPLRPFGAGPRPGKLRRRSPRLPRPSEWQRGTP